MTTLNPYPAFRLNLEQQKKRAKELLRAAQAGETEALQRLQAHTNPADNQKLTLAAAQHALARELRFASWSALKQHIHAMQQQRELAKVPASDASVRTLHIRCGHDIQQALQETGLGGDFAVHINPYVQGPVTTAADSLEQRARFICESCKGTGLTLDYEQVLQGCRDEEQTLSHAISDYQRVVLWFELDAHDQLILLRCLAYFAQHGLPKRLELISVGDFPGTQRFLGLGQLPPEALRLLWTQRKVLTVAHTALAANVWKAYSSDDPRDLAHYLHADTSLLPQLHAALHRQLQELPSLDNGLGATQQLLLQTLARTGNTSVARLLGEAMLLRDPYSGIADGGLYHELRLLSQTREAIVVLEQRGSMRADEVDITALGRQVLAGRVNLMSLQLPPRWVGGVCIRGGQRNWHWDEAKRQVLLQ